MKMKSNLRNISNDDDNEFVTNKMVILNYSSDSGTE